MAFRVPVAMALLVWGTTLAACGNDAVPPDDQQPVTAQEALAAGGLSLPETYAELTFATPQIPGQQGTYRITFRTGRENATDLCSQAGLGGDLPAVRLSGREIIALGEGSDVSGDARYCSSVLPDDTSWNRTVLVESGDPAFVRIAVVRQER